MKTHGPSTVYTLRAPFVVVSLPYEYHSGAKCLVTVYVIKILEIQNLTKRVHYCSPHLTEVGFKGLCTVRTSLYLYL